MPLHLRSGAKTQRHSASDSSDDEPPNANASLVKAVALGALQLAPANKENSCADSPAHRANASPVPSRVLTPNGNSPCRQRDRGSFSTRHSLSAEWQAGLEAALAIQALHAGHGLDA